jgi:hypothetical protein
MSSTRNDLPVPPPSSSSESSASSPPASHSLSPSSYLTYPVTHVVSGLYRRLTEPTPDSSPSRPVPDVMSSSEVYSPPRRTASPFQPPPLTPLTLKVSSNASHLLLTRSLAEEIRLLVPPRLQLLDTWQLAYSLDRDGSSLATLYENCKIYSRRSQRAGYVLVVRDVSSLSASPPSGGSGNLFGAYLTDPPHPSPHYYGTGECFLWRASVLRSSPPVQIDRNGKDKSTNGGVHSHELVQLAGLPLPPSADTTNLRGRSTTLKGEEECDDSHNSRYRFYLDLSLVLMWQRRRLVSQCCSCSYYQLHS